MSPARFKWAAAISDYARRIELLAYQPEDGGGMKAIALPVALTFAPTVHPDAFVEEPTFKLNYKEAQSLVDALLAAGIKPSMPSDESRQVEAIKYHLEDMRKLAFLRTVDDFEKLKSA